MTELEEILIRFHLSKSRTDKESKLSSINRELFHRLREEMFAEEEDKKRVDEAIEIIEEVLENYKIPVKAKKRLEEALTRLEVVTVEVGKYDKK